MFLLRVVPVVIAGVLLSLAEPARTQELADLTGSVVDSTSGAPLPVASIAVLGKGMGAHASSQGIFQLPQLAPGPYTLRASYIGYSSRDTTVTLSAGQSLHVVLALAKLQAAGSVEKITVRAPKKLVDVSEISTVRELDAAEIAALTVDNLADVVERQVGVSGEGEDLHIRGGRSDETLFRIEGVAMRNVVTGASAGGTFSAKALQSLEVITGGYQAEFGQAISGIVNAELKEAGYDRITTIEYGTGKWDTERMLFQTEGPLTPRQYPLPGRVTLLLGLEVLASDTYLPSLRQATNGGFGSRRTLRSGRSNTFSGLRWHYDDLLRLRQQNSVNFYSKFTWRMSQRHKVNVTFTKYAGLDHGFGRFRVGDEVRDAASGNTAYPWAFRDQLDQAPTFLEETSLQSVSWRWTVSDGSFSRLSLSHFSNNLEESVRGKRPWMPGEEYDEWRSTGSDTFFVSDENGDFPRYQDVFSERYSIAGSFTQLWSKHHEFKTGFESNYHILQMVRIENPREGEGGLGNLRDLYRVFPNDGAFYLQNSFSYEGFIGHAGLRGEYIFLGQAADEAAAADPNIAESYAAETNSLFGRRYKVFWSPRLGINHPITDRSSMHFNFGHFIQWPRFIYYFAKISSRSSEAFPIEGNLNLRPERSVQFEFGVEQQVSDHMAFDVTLYNKDTYDYPFATQPNEATRQRLVYVNSDFSRTRGIELVLKRSGARRLTGSLSYEFQIATGKPADPNRIQQVDPEALETGEAEPELNEEFMPWNRPHRIQTSIGLRFGPGDRPKLWKWRLPDRWRLDWFYTFRSGKPYTPTDERRNRTGKRNSENAPAESVLDMKFRKYWNYAKHGQLGLSFELRNVFDSAPLRTVDSATGKAPAFGEGTLCEGCITSDVDDEVVRARIANPAYYGEGRNFRLGLEVTF